MVSLFASFAFVLQARLADMLVSIPDYTTHCVVYLAWSLPLVAFMAAHLYSPALAGRMQQRVARALPNLSRKRSTWGDPASSAAG